MVITTRPRSFSHTVLTSKNTAIRRQGRSIAASEGLAPLGPAPGRDVSSSHGLVPTQSRESCAQVVVSSPAKRAPRGGRGRPAPAATINVLLLVPRARESARRTRGRSSTRGGSMNAVVAIAEGHRTRWRRQARPRRPRARDAIIGRRRFCGPAALARHQKPPARRARCQRVQLLRVERVSRKNRAGIARQAPLHTRPWAVRTAIISPPPPSTEVGWRQHDFRSPFAPGPSYLLFARGLGRAGQVGGRLMWSCPGVALLALGKRRRGAWWPRYEYENMK